MEIGGIYEFPNLVGEDPVDSAYKFLINAYNNYKFVRDGRQAIKLVLLNIDGIENLKCYLPAYLCDSILQPFNEMGLDVKFYEHEPVLNPVLDNIENSLIYIIDYFGIETISNKEIIELLDRNNVVILDISQSLLNENRFSSEIENYSENYYIISSLRKIFPIPDGGMVHYQTDKLNDYSLGFPEGYDERLEAMVLRSFYLKEFEIDVRSMESSIDNDKLEDLVADLGSEKSHEDVNQLEDMKKHFLSLYHDYERDKYEKILRPQNIPLISLRILNNISYHDILGKRSENLKFVYQEINDENRFLFDLKRIKCPFMLPLIFSNEEERNSAKTIFIKNKIYPQIIWEIEEFVPKRYSYEHDLSRRVLMVPTDQRYSPNELNKVVELLNNPF